MSHRRGLPFIVGLLLGLLAPLFADVKSSTGTLSFDVNGDGQKQMVLNANGLGIGTSSPSSNLQVSGNTLLTGTLSVGSSTASDANLHVSGTLAFSNDSISDDSTLSQHSMVSVDTSTKNVAATLPYAGNVIGRKITVIKTHASNNLLITGGGNLMDDLSQLILTTGNTGAVSFVSSESQWHILTLTPNISRVQTVIYS